MISTRYRTVFEITLPQRVRYSDATRMTILLRGGSGTVGNAFITIHILLDGEAVSALNATLNSLGSTQIDLRGQPAGNLTITVRYEGSPTYAPCLNQYRLEIEPIVSIRAAPVSGQFLGENMTVSIISTVEGAVSGWTGALLVDIMSPAGIILGHWQFEVASAALLYVWAVPAIAGEYRVSMTIVGLPLVDEYTRSDSIAVTPRPLGIPLDAGTTPVVSGGLALGVIAFALKRKMGSLLASLPVEWNDEGV